MKLIYPLGATKNIGVSTYSITTNLNNLMEDAQYQIIQGNLQTDEIAYKFHHRLVAIHPFPNGNGRHARLMTDLLLIAAGQPRFTWGRAKLEVESETRKQYINALKDADKHDYKTLAQFVRS